MELFESELDISVIVDGVTRLVGPRAESAKIKVSTKIPDDLPHLFADERLVKQMILNLLSNSLEFTPEDGAVTIGAQVRKGNFLIGVSDTGVGMSQEEAELALQPFKQVDGSHTREHEGTGLGLPLVKSFIELHGGHLRLDSGPGCGTTVTLSFPAERIVSEPGPQAEADPPEIAIA